MNDSAGSWTYILTWQPTGYLGDCERVEWVHDVYVCLIQIMTSKDGDNIRSYYFISWITPLGLYILSLILVILAHIHAYIYAHIFVYIDKYA